MKALCCVLAYFDYSARRIPWDGEKKTGMTLYGLAHFDLYMLAQTLNGKRIHFHKLIKTRERNEYFSTSITFSWIPFDSWVRSVRKFLVRGNFVNFVMAFEYWEAMPYINKLLEFTGNMDVVTYHRQIEVEIVKGESVEVCGKLLREGGGRKMEIEQLLCFVNRWNCFGIFWIAHKKNYIAVLLQMLQTLEKFSSSFSVCFF